MVLRQSDKTANPDLAGASEFRLVICQFLVPGPDHFSSIFVDFQTWKQNE
jgi:hypothetical protein